MSTLTMTQSHQQGRFRSFSLSLVARHSSPLLALPAELIIDIITFALTESKVNALATICKDITCLLNTILYRTVSFRSTRSMSLFYQASRSNPSLTTHVRNFTVTENSVLDANGWRRVWDILSRATGLLSLSLKEGYPPSSMALILADPSHDSLSAVTIQRFHASSASVGPACVAPISHLRICEPSDQWHSPSEILSSFGSLPALTHLQLCRRMNGNEENDLAFVEEITSILSGRARLRMLVVTVFPQMSAGEEQLVDSGIWGLLKAVADERLVVKRSGYGLWLKDDPWAST
ncbi:uncharacterized protein BT62DRAFT_928453 [Guyanagaster necrorhizus]|uniref:F-box domain-containing protein n=1 Tax=Guyanagaster necrorhizus TaxID=856835 RepID=A0A9P8AVM3_9AGAR|nr:uncharacterized protein BT62DRAFT_928453 [Guyanagaster necrorhizus MCA 3950]KAG7449719.1 hypothetical protein BT62DRAFT_928453 [Guyanagaster necrorhizus MCA 3950]